MRPSQRRRSAGKVVVAAAATAAVAATTNQGIQSLTMMFPSPFRGDMAGAEHGFVLVGVPGRPQRCTEITRFAAQACNGCSADLDGPDPSVTGQLRALGRLLRTASRRLVVASTDAGAYLPSDFCKLQVASCGSAMQGAAEALLAEQWQEAEKCICDLPSQCDALLCKEDLKALQSVLAGWLPGHDLHEALIVIGKKLEAATETADEALKDVLFDLAAALRSGARLFAFKPHSTGPQHVFQKLQQQLAQMPLEQHQAYLRQLAKRYHPDRNPGNERDVLPVFLHVQCLRNAHQRWK
mmetsp:Transcript_7907/g.13798  ORF Transcript_7907/g.13798 Transcript_7907/m.13798 type:complete len:296 (+) Transcript_7907:84-971(+)